MLTLGIDIGTTSVCGVVFDSEDRIIRKAVNRPNDSSVTPDQPWMQDAERISLLAGQILEELKADIAVEAVGVTGQMHGIVYTDHKGRALSPLFTWKDARADQEYRGGLSYAEYLTQQTGYCVFAGYGIATHYYCQTNRLIPEGAAAIMTIADYLILHLTGQCRTHMDASMAASLGCFDAAGGDFDKPALEKAGVDTAFLPDVVSDAYLCGRYEDIPVYAALGDNQASFLAAAEDLRKGICVNVGTGSQVSVWYGEAFSDCQADVRPFPGGGSLYVGASLNGGKAYELLGRFFSEVCERFMGTQTDPYEVMNRLALEEGGSGGLSFSPLFYGTRGKEGVLASISGLSPAGFHVPQLVKACIRGMAEELHDLYLAMPMQVREGKEYIYCSGNGIRRNAALRQQVEDVFGLPVRVARYEEEAAAGAAMWAASSSRTGKH